MNLTDEQKNDLTIAEAKRMLPDPSATDISLYCAMSVMKEALIQCKEQIKELETKLEKLEGRK